MGCILQQSLSSGFVALLFALVTSAQTTGKISTLLELTTTNYGTAFDFELEVGGQTFHFPPDTGSADMWVLVDGYQCERPQGGVTGTHTVSEDTCGFGDATYSQSPSFKPINNVYIGDHYGFGNDIGLAGYESVRIGNITIPQQQMGFVNFTSDIGDGLNNGNCGLGYAQLGAFHPVDYKANSSTDLLFDRVLYNTPILNMVQQGMESYFSMALERIPLNQLQGFGGYLGFGTLPPVPHGEFVSTPVEVSKGIPKTFTNGTSQISEWTLTVQGLEWNGQTSNTPFQAVVDTANWVNVFPRDIADKINADFDPPAKYADSFYTVACDATPPSNFRMKIGGTLFDVNPVDMIWRDATGTCYSSIATLTGESGITLMFVGDVFLKSVVAVFDFGNDEMRFAPRLDSGSNSTFRPVPATGRASAPTIHVGAVVMVALASLLWL